MRKLILVAAMVASLAVGVGTAAASYTSSFGNTYTDEQMREFCSAVRPGSPSYIRYNCDEVLGH